MPNHHADDPLRWGSSALLESFWGDGQRLYTQILQVYFNRFVVAFCWMFGIGECALGASSSENGDWAAAAAAAESAVDEREREQQAEAEMAEAKEKLHLLQLQTLKYSTVWLLVRVSKASKTECSTSSLTVV